MYENFLENFFNKNFFIVNYTGFVEHPRISRVVRDPSSCTFIEEYLLDNQAVEQSHAFILWMSIMKYKNIQVPQKNLLPKFFLIFFLGRNYIG